MLENRCKEIHIEYKLGLINQWKMYHVLSHQLFKLKIFITLFYFFLYIYIHPPGTHPNHLCSLK